MFNSEIKDKFISAFSTKILAIRNYKAEKTEFFTDDFLNIPDLEDFLEEIHTGESDITPAGKSFLQHYYGFDTLADLLSERDSLSLNKEASTSEAIKSWLENIKPMEIFAFIEESRGHTVEGLPLRADLLPPENIEELLPDSQE
jgi:hypothetical protein